ncbi:MAG TPA: DUF992 domain-containing protein [Stellaceae bacterium]|nr:DUF992 domain-containing protein [Stellaceae bacterium]
MTLPQRLRAMIGAAIFGLAAAIPAMPARAAGVQVGVLTCNEASGWGFIFGSSHALHCIFSSNTRALERYAGTIAKFGVDIGYLRGGVIVWAVFAPSTSLAPGSLAGAYGGATAGAAVGVGAAANALIGGSIRTIELQPLSIEGASGLNVAAGIAQIRLSYRP